MTGKEAGSKNWIRIRDAKPGDVDALYNLDVRSFSLPWTRDDFEHDLTDNILSIYLLAETCDAIIAYAGVWVVIDECHIMTFAVDPGWRRQGVATMIMLQLLARARLAGAKQFTLEVRKSNEAAIGLYEKFGFETIGVRPEYYEDNKEDASIMWKYD